ncbi:MAG: hypothetical protein FJX23_06730, partial [Alphaproteobacteria bacterium]|nr:hypothetical protein [Alphaproteobacteria bacterium]
MRHSEFSYDNLNTQSNRKAGVYSTTPVNTSFFALCHDHAPMDRVTGWKFHISVAQQDVGKA